MSRVCSGQAERSQIPVSSITKAPSRLVPSVSIAGRQSSSWARSKAPLTWPDTGNPSAEHARVQALHRRFMKLPAAARQLQVSFTTVRVLLGRDELELDPETDTSVARFVTARARPPATRGGRSPADIVA